MTICAIHQPNFIPWLPYFDKIFHSNIFIFLDEVAYPKSGNSMGSWCNRVKIKMNESDIWFSCPVLRESGPQIINTVKINYDQLLLNKWMHTLECAYARYVNFDLVKNFILEVYEEKHVFLSDFNISIIKKVCKLLDLNISFVKQSELEVKTSSNQMLVDLCKKVNADNYLSGTGALGYMDSSMYEDNGIKVVYQEQNYTDQIAKMKHYSILHYLVTTERDDWSKFNVRN